MLRLRGAEVHSKDGLEVRKQDVRDTEEQAGGTVCCSGGSQVRSGQEHTGHQC